MKRMMKGLVYSLALVCYMTVTAPLAVLGIVGIGCGAVLGRCNQALDRLSDMLGITEEEEAK